jgi:hypothetical protein
MYKLKNSDEYSVIASTKNQAIKKFKKDLGIVVTKNMIEKIW